MLASFKRQFGIVTVKEKNNLITVEGIPGTVMEANIARAFNTTRITSHMFTSIGRSSFSFESFFALDVIYLLDVLINTRKGISVRTLDKIRDELYKETWLKSTLPTVDVKGRLNYDNFKRLKKSPLPHQKEFFESYNYNVDRYNLNGMLASAAPGAGKTLMSLMIAEGVDADNIIVICPKNATQRVWEKTVLEEYHKEQTYWLAQYGKPYKGERILIAHYEALPTVLDIAKKGKFQGKETVIVLDESHNLNEIKSQRTQLFLELCSTVGSRNIIPASGTPVKAMGGELIPLLRMLDPLFTESAEARFKKIFGKEGARGLELLKNRLGIISYKIEKSALNLDKPIMKSMPIKMPTGNNFTLKAIRVRMEAFIRERAEYYKSRRAEDERFWRECIAIHESTLNKSADKLEYEKYKKALKIVISNPDPRYVGEEITYTNWYEKNKIEPTLPARYIKQFRDVKSVIKYTKLKIQGECLGRVLGRARIECHVDMVKYIDFVSVVDSTLKKTVVFTSFVEALEVAADQCKKLNLNPLVVYGKTNNELASIVKDFEQDKELNPLIATYNSLSTAVPLVMADTMIMINAPFRAYIQEQAISRIHRIGADTQTTVYQCHLDTGTEPNISTRSADILAWSQEMVEEITGVKSPFKIEASIESIPNKNTDYDETSFFNNSLIKHFGALDIDVTDSLEDLVEIKMAPAFIGW